MAQAEGVLLAEEMMVQATEVAETAVLEMIEVTAGTGDRTDVQEILEAPAAEEVLMVEAAQVVGAAQVAARVADRLRTSSRERPGNKEAMSRPQ